MPIRRNERQVSNQDLEALLSAFENGTTVTEGGLSYTMLGFQELYEILPDAFAVTPPLGRSKAVSLFGRALRAARHQGPLTPATLLEQAEQLHRQDQAVREQSFTLWTKFRAGNMAHQPGFRLSWNGVSLHTAAYLPNWLKLNDYFFNGVGRIYPNEPTFYGHIILTCADREESSAVDRMLDALQLVMGLANMYETWGRWSASGGRGWTEGKLWLGPSQFVFRGRASRGEERLWHNPDYDKAAWDRHPAPMSRILQVVPQVRRALTALTEHPLRDVLIHAVLLMQEGFASRDGSHRLLRYWSALEQLYVEKGARDRSNQKVVDRAVFAESEPRLSRWKLNHIARLRNEYVHAGGHDDDLLAMGQFLRELLARHLNHWIFRGGDFPDHQALLSYVSLPGDDASLIAMRDAINRRLALIDEGRATQADEEME